MSSHSIRIQDSSRSSGEQAILDAATRLFSRQGFDGVSMRQIAEVAEVSKANIYHHFDSKEALYLAILRAGAERLGALVENLAEGRGTFEQRLRVFAESHLDNLFENSGTLRLVLRESFADGEEKSRVLVAQVFGGIFQRMIAIFRAGQQAGELRADLDPGLCATLLMGGDVFFFQFSDVARHFPEAGFARLRKDYSRAMVDVLLNGMLAGGGEGRDEA